MAKASKKVIRGVKLLEPSRLDRESRASVAVTVVWMLTSLACLVAQLLAVALAGLERWRGIGPSGWTQVAAAIWLVALSMGLLFLAITPVTYRVRTDRPPLSLTLFCVFVAVIPLFRMAWILADEMLKAPRPITP